MPLHHQWEEQLELGADKATYSADLIFATYALCKQQSTVMS